MGSIRRRSCTGSFLRLRLSSRCWIDKDGAIFRRCAARGKDLFRIIIACKQPEPVTVLFWVQYRDLGVVATDLLQQFTTLFISLAYFVPYSKCKIQFFFFKYINKTVKRLPATFSLNCCRRLSLQSCSAWLGKWSGPVSVWFRVCSFCSS